MPGMAPWACMRGHEAIEEVGRNGVVHHFGGRPDLASDSMRQSMSTIEEMVPTSMTYRDATSSSTEPDDGSEVPTLAKGTPSQRALDPRHSHFILVDGEDASEFRAKFEKVEWTPTSEETLSF